MARNYWQIAAGSFGRDYAKLFTKYGIAFVGGESHMATMQKVKPNDIIVLRSGRSKILAAGQVVKREDGISKGIALKETELELDYANKDWLLDYDGWVLPAFCYVDWRIPKNPVKTTGLSRTTIQQLPQEKHRKIADQIMTNSVKERESEPYNTKKITDEEILEFLISEGLRTITADNLTNTIRRIRLLAKYYYDSDFSWNEGIGEHEIRTFLVVPLLLALGWTEQQLKIEYKAGAGRADIVGFTRPYHFKDKECSLIIETKDFGSGLDYAPDQAKSYAKKFSSCRVLVVSNGYCYKSYVRKKGEFSEIPTAYFNILRPRDRYPLDPESVNGTIELLRWLIPKSY